MGLCLQCNKWINQPEGKRKKVFCNNTCRSNYWYGKNKKNKKSPISEKEALPEGYYGTKLHSNIMGDEPLSFDKLKQQMASETPFQLFQRQLMEAEYSEDLQKIGRKIESSHLSQREKQFLHGLGQQIFNDKFTF